MKKTLSLFPFGLVQIAKLPILCIVLLHLQAIEPSAAGIKVITIAGSGEYSSSDGPALAAGLVDPIGIAVDPAGAILFTQAETTIVRKVTLDKKVITIAGKIRRGHKDGPVKEAELNSPMALAVDSKGNIYVSDSENHCIRVIKPDGMVTTIAGTPGKAGFADGPGKAAQFNGPRGIAFDGEGNLIVADLGNNRIRKIILP